MLILAWCPGQNANVIEVTKEQYDSCTNLSAAGARHGPASYTVPIDTPGTYYFANGVGEACKKGWKIKIVVISLGQTIG